MFSSLYVFFYLAAHPRDLHSFPTRRSSDLLHRVVRRAIGPPAGLVHRHDPRVLEPRRDQRLTHEPQLADRATRDRKSTRLNSSHANISYAVFCLKKKNEYHISHTTSPAPGH